MLTSKITQQIEHPDEPGVSFTLRRLSYAQCEEAEEVKRDKMVALMKSLEGITLPTGEEGAVPNPAVKYDRTTVLRHGITDWSYDAPCDEANIVDLDEITAAWLFSAIIAHSLRSADEGEASGSASSRITA